MEVFTNRNENTMRHKFWTWGLTSTPLLRGRAQDEIGIQRVMGLSLLFYAVCMQANQPMRLQSEL
jgi:hypothetical protein